MSPDKMKRGIRYPWRNAEDLASTAAGYEDGLFSARHNPIFSRTCGDYSSDRLSRNLNVGRNPATLSDIVAKGQPTYENRVHGSVRRQEAGQNGPSSLV